MTRYATKFWGIFSAGQLLFSNLNGMAFLYDDEDEARAQAKLLAEQLPEQGFEVKAALLVEEEE